MSKRKRLGQHFLKNPYVIRKMIHYINPQPSEIIIEIGAGKGALTFPLAQRAEKVIAIEKDKKFIPYLKERGFPNLEILEGDILRLDFKDLIPPNKKVKIVGNLPYSISSPILFKIYNQKELIPECYFLLQKEVAERVCALPNTKSFAPISILFQIFFITRIIFYVSRKSFSPSPKVDSAFINLKKREKPLFEIESESKFIYFLKGIFRERRKILINNLKRMKYPDDKINEIFKKLKLDYFVRTEDLDISQIVEMYNILE